MLMCYVMCWSWFRSLHPVRWLVGRFKTHVLRAFPKRSQGKAVCACLRGPRTDVYTRRINSSFLFTGRKFGALSRPISDFLTHSLCSHKRGSPPRSYGVIIT